MGFRNALVIKFGLPAGHRGGNLPITVVTGYCRREFVGYVGNIAIMTKTGRAAVYDAPNTPFVIREFPVRDVKPDEVLVQITMSTICRSDIHSYQGHRPNPCPGILGHEIVGVIDQLGENIVHDMRGDQLAVGVRVTWTEYFYHGESYYRDVHDMPQKSPGLRKYGHALVEDDPHFLGGFADYCYILPGRVRRRARKLRREENPCHQGHP